MLRPWGPPHIRRLRALVGTDLLLIPSVAVLVWSPARELLLVRDRAGGCWTTPGGAIEPDESPADAARRETREEAGVEIALDALVGVLGGPEFRHVYPNGDVASVVPVVYDAHIAEGEPAPDGEEVDAVRWFDPCAIGAPLTPHARAARRAGGACAPARTR